MKHLLLASLLATSCAAQPIEVGTVTWGRDLAAALASSADSSKPIFALFQEVPGCAGCQNFGREVLSHPLIVSAIESDFTPLLIHNNQPGPDAEVLKRFDEPAWNYQVVRFLDSAGDDLLPRKDQVWEVGALATRMVRALEVAKKPVPPYLSLLAAERSAGLRTAAFGMHCFWTGEMALGQIEGVITTEAGFIDGREVTLVRYDEETLSLPQLVAAAQKVECAHSVWVPEPETATARASRLTVGTLTGYRTAPARDQKKQLQGTSLAGIPLSPSQATKANAWIRVDPQMALIFLTPGQRSQLQP